VAVLTACGPRRGILTAVVTLAGAAVASPRGIAAQLTQDEALALAFQGADSVHRATAYLDDAQRARVAELAGPGVEADVGVVTYYVAHRRGRATGVAYFDAHRVRTHPEVLMIVVGEDDRIRRVEVVRFDEPPEYRPPDGWLDLMEDRPLDDRLSLKGEIPRITGATLTSRAATAAVRRVLALHAVIAPFGDAEPGG